jgi:hypothetical protein
MTPNPADLLPTEFYDGEWHLSDVDGQEPLAIISYTFVPVQDTGHVGWIWWAMESMGDALTYQDARSAAEAEIRRCFGDLAVRR